jgi:CDP-diacylglycerol--glycerol-3-phosphate 3-phosphatidyltransferase
MTLSSYIVIAIVAAGLLTMPLFALASGRRSMDPDVARRGATVLLGRWVRDWLMWLIAPLERGLLRIEISPDVLNVAGGVLGGAAGVAYARGALPLAGGLVLAGGLADVLDGRVARARGMANAYGEYLDSVIDRFAETFTFVGLAWHFAPSPGAVALPAAALGGSMLVSYARAKGDALRVANRGGLMQRAERLVLLAAASIFGATLDAAFGWEADTTLTVAVALIAVGAIGTAAWRAAAIARELRSRSKR